MQEKVKISSLDILKENLLFISDVTQYIILMREHFLVIVITLCNN